MTDCCDKWEELDSRWKGYADAYVSYYPTEWRDLLEIESNSIYEDKSPQLKGKDRLLLGDLIQAQIGILVDNEDNPDWEEVNELIDLHRRIVTLHKTRSGKDRICERHPASPERIEWELDNGDIVRGNWKFAHDTAKKVGSNCVKRKGERIRHRYQTWDKP